MMIFLTSFWTYKGSQVAKSILSIIVKQKNFWVNGMIFCKKFGEELDFYYICGSVALITGMEEALPYAILLGVGVISTVLLAVIGYYILKHK